MHGLFITFEGIDGCGKTTQATMLADALKQSGRTVVHTREPGGTPLGNNLRELMLHRADLELGYETEVLLMCADRAHHVQTVLRPALLQDKIIVCERYTDSTLAYQGYANHVDERGLQSIEAMNMFATGGLMPHITFLLDLEPDVAKERRQDEADRIESKHRDYHRRVREGYLNIAAHHPGRVVVVDASQRPQDVHATIMNHLSKERLWTDAGEA